MKEVSELTPNIGTAWSSIRGILREFSFAMIKDIVGAAGLPVERLAHLQQKFRGGASKGQLMDEIDTLILELEADRRGRIVVGCIEEILRMDSGKHDALQFALARLGFGIAEGTVFSLAMQIDVEMSDLPDDIRVNISKGLHRYRDGDYAGAITAICGGVDKLAQTQFFKHKLGDLMETAFQERVTKAFYTLETDYCFSLSNAGVPDNEVKLVWNNHKKAVTNAAYVLGAFRRQYSDAHGVQSAPQAFVQKALDCGIFIIRSFFVVTT
jgi:hypothetical protein